MTFVPLFSRLLALQRSGKFKYSLVRSVPEETGIIKCERDGAGAHTPIRPQKLVIPFTRGSRFNETGQFCSYNCRFARATTRETRRNARRFCETSVVSLLRES